MKNYVVFSAARHFSSAEYEKYLRIATPDEMEKDQVNINTFHQIAGVPTYLDDRDIITNAIKSDHLVYINAKMVKKTGWTP